MYLCESSTIYFDTVHPLPNYSQLDISLSYTSNPIYFLSINTCAACIHLVVLESTEHGWPTRGH